MIFTHQSSLVPRHSLVPLAVIRGAGVLIQQASVGLVEFISG